MIVTGIDLRKESGLVRAEAQVAWEDAGKPALSLFAEADARFEDALWPDPNAFLVACLLPAWHAGERRVRIDESLCPVLCGNMQAAMLTLRSWYPEFGPPPTIEPARGFKAHQPFRDQAASFLSCGIDSLATLRSNNLLLGPDHPASIRAAILVDFIEAAYMTEQEARNLDRLAAARRVTAGLGVEPIPVRTNVLRLDGDGWFFSYKWHGAVLSAVAHFLSRRFSRAYIASTHDAAHLGPWGSHPMLDSCYSSGHLQVEHHGVGMTRFQKVALVADWPAGLQNILVCQGRNTGGTNCGACEKCIRTMTALVAAGKLQDCRAFPADDVSAELLATVREYDMIYSESQASYYSELIPALTDRGRDDLVGVIREVLLPHARKQSESEFAARDVAGLIPPGDGFILADQERFGGRVGAEREGYVWGPPPDDDAAIRELNSLRGAGANFIVFRRPVFWWLEHYPRFGQYLREHFSCLLDGERLIVFDLR